MLNWLKRRRSQNRMPEYAAIRRMPNRSLPSDLVDSETSHAFAEQRETIERTLREPPRRPAEQHPLFVVILAARNGSVLAIDVPGSESRCLPIFSSPFRAADYTRTLLPPDAAVNYLFSSPQELVRMLRDLRARGIDTLTLDRCPRCNIFTTIRPASITTADDAIQYWSITKASELARLDLYLCYAQASARAGALETAREVAFETIAHVGIEDPRTHFLVGQIAVALHDRDLLREAKAFLRFLNLDAWERKLDEADGGSEVDFEFPR